MAKKRLNKSKISKIKMPNPGAWLTNVGKSFGLATVDIINDIMPATSEIAENVSDYASDFTTHMRELKSQGKRLSDAVTNNVYANMLKDAKSNAIKDLMSGELYARPSFDDGFDSSDDDFGDMDFGDDFDVGDDEDYNSEFTSDDGEVHAVTSHSKGEDVDVSTVNVKVDSNKFAESIDNQTKVVVDLNTLSTKQSEAFNNTLLAEVSNNGRSQTTLLGSIDSNMTTVVSVLQNMGEASSLGVKYYDDSMTIFNQMNETLTAIKTSLSTEGASNGKITGDMSQYEGRYNNVLDDLFTGSGLLDVDAYKEYAKKQTKNAVASNLILSQVMNILDNKDMFEDMVKHPLKGMVTSVVKTVIPAVTRDAAEAFDNTLQKSMTTLLYRLRGLKGNENPIYDFIGNAFGISNRLKTDVDKSNYNKGKVDWNGESHKTLNEVIPYYLRKIAASVSGEQEMAFDYNTGTFKTLASIRKDYEESERRDMTREFSSSLSTIRDNIEKSYALSAKDKKSVDKALDDLAIKMMKQDGSTAYYKNDSPLEYVAKMISNGDETDQIAQIIAAGINSMSHNEIMDFLGGRDALAARASFSRRKIQEEAGEIPSNIRYINDGTGKANTHLKFNDTKKEYDGISYKVSPFVEHDKYGKTPTYYLRDIYKLLINGINVFPKTELSTSGESDTTAVVNAFMDRINSSGIMRDNDYLSGYDRKDRPVNDTHLTENQIKEAEKHGRVVVGDVHRDTNASLYDQGMAAYRLVTANEEAVKRTRISNAAKITGLDDNQPLTRIINKFNEYLQKPGQIMADMFKKADDFLFKLVFGDINKGGSSMFTVAMAQIKMGVRKMSNWLNEKIFIPLEDKLFGDDGIFKKIENSQFMQNMKSKMNEFKDWVLGDLDPETGLRSGGLLSETANEFHYMGSEVKEYLFGDQPDSVKSNLKNIGSNISNSILASVGIDVEDIKERKKNGDYHPIKDLMSDVSERFKTAGANVIDAIFGGIDTSTEGGASSFKESFKKDLDDITKNDKGALGAGAVMGAVGIPLLAANSGIIGSFFLPGGPIGGALLGMGLMIAHKSDTIQDFLFGKINDEGIREGGIINKNLSNAFMDNKAGIAVGAFGGLAASMGFLPAFFFPGGPIGGALVGMGASLAIKSETMQRFLFGDLDENGERDGTGLLGKAKSFFKNAPGITDKGRFLDTGIGAGLGVLGSMFFLPGGPIMGALLGAAGGFALSSEKMQEFLFGKDDGHGKRTGGIISRTTEKISNIIMPAVKQAQAHLMGFVERSIMVPLMTGIRPILELGRGFVARTGKAISNMFHSITTVASDFLVGTNGILRPLIDVGKFVGKATQKVTESIISAPFKLIEAVGKTLDLGARLRNLLSPIIDGVISPVLNAVKTAISTVVKTVVKATTDFITLPFRIIRGTVMGAVNGIKKLFSAGANMVKNSVPGMVVSELLANRRVKKNQTDGQTGLFGWLNAHSTSRGKWENGHWVRNEDYVYNPTGIGKRYKDVTVRDKTTGELVVDRETLSEKRYNFYKSNSNFEVTAGKAVTGRNLWQENKAQKQESKEYEWYLTAMSGDTKAAQKARNKLIKLYGGNDTTEYYKKLFSGDKPVDRRLFDEILGHDYWVGSKTGRSPAAIKAEQEANAKRQMYRELRAEDMIVNKLNISDAAITELVNAARVNNDDRKANADELEKLNKQLNNPNLTDEQRADIQSKVEQRKVDSDKELESLKKKLDDKNLTDEQRARLESQIEDREKTNNQEINALERQLYDSKLTDEQISELQAQIKEREEKEKTYETRANDITNALIEEQDKYTKLLEQHTEILDRLNNKVESLQSKVADNEKGRQYSNIIGKLGANAPKARASEDTTKIASLNSNAEITYDVDGNPVEHQSELSKFVNSVTGPKIEPTDEDITYQQTPEAESKVVVPPTVNPFTNAVDTLSNVLFGNSDSKKEETELETHAVTEPVVTGDEMSYARGSGNNSDSEPRVTIISPDETVVANSDKSQQAKDAEKENWFKAFLRRRSENFEKKMGAKADETGALGWLHRHGKKVDAQEAAIKQFAGEKVDDAKLAVANGVQNVKDAASEAAQNAANAAEQRKSNNEEKKTKVIQAYDRSKEKAKEFAKTIKELPERIALGIGKVPVFGTLAKGLFGEKYFDKDGDKVSENRVFKKYGFLGGTWKFIFGNKNAEEGTNANLGLIGRLTKGIQSFFNETWMGRIIKMIFKVAIGGAVLGLATKFFKTTIWPVVEPIASKIINGVINWWSEKAWPALSGVFSRIWTTFDEFMSNSKFGESWNNVKTKMNDIVDYFKNPTEDSVWGKVKKVFGDFKDALQGQYKFTDDDGEQHTGGLGAFFKYSVVKPLWTEGKKLFTEGWTETMNTYIKPIMNLLGKTLSEWWIHKTDTSYWDQQVTDNLKSQGLLTEETKHRGVTVRDKNTGKVIVDNQDLTDEEYAKYTSNASEYIITGGKVSTTNVATANLGSNTFTQRLEDGDTSHHGGSWYDWILHPIDSTVNLFGGYNAVVFYNYSPDGKTLKIIYICCAKDVFVGWLRKKVKNVVPELPEDTFTPTKPGWSLVHSKNIKTLTTDLDVSAMKGGLFEALMSYATSDKKYLGFKSENAMKLSVLNDTMHPAGYLTGSADYILTDQDKKGVNANIATGFSISGGNGDGPKVKNNFPYYSQNDPSIKNSPYVMSNGVSGYDDTMGARGCGPTAMAMVASKLKGGYGNPYTPQNMARLAEVGNYSTEVGTTPEYFTDVGSQLGMNVTPADGTKNNIKEMLSTGNPVIIQGKSNDPSSPFTSAGHYVVGVGLDKSGNKVVVNDPMGESRSKTYSIDKVAKDSGMVWEFDNSNYAGTGLPITRLRKAGRLNIGGRGYGENTKWMSIVKAVKAAIAAQKPGYSQSNWITIEIDGKKLRVRTDCSGFVAACLKYYGVLPDNTNLTSNIMLSTASYNPMYNTGFSRIKCDSGLSNCKTGDIIVRSGHVEIYVGPNRVYNCGSDSSVNYAGATGLSYKSYDTIWRPGDAGADAIEGLNYDDNGVTTTTTRKTNTLSSIFSAVSDKLLDPINKFLYGETVTTTSSDGTTTTYDNSSPVSSGYSTARKGDEVAIPDGLGTQYPYMGWQMIKSPSSTQYKLRQQAGQNFDDLGYGKINGRYVVALTDTFGKVGDYVDIKQNNGNVIKAVIGDVKNQNDEGCNKWGHNNGKAVVEFVVDKSKWYGTSTSVKTTHPEWQKQRVVSIKNQGSYFNGGNGDIDIDKAFAEDPAYSTVVNNKPNNNDVKYYKKDSDYKFGGDGNKRYSSKTGGFGHYKLDRAFDRYDERVKSGGYGAYDDSTVLTLMGQMLTEMRGTNSGINKFNSKEFGNKTLVVDNANKSVTVNNTNQSKNNQKNPVRNPNVLFSNDAYTVAKQVASGLVTI